MTLRINARILFSASLVLLSACSDCQFPDSAGSPAPDWICQPAVSGYQFTALGFAEKSAAGVRHMKQMALADARRQLIRQLASSDNPLNSERAELINSKPLHSIVSPAGNLYMLVGTRLPPVSN